MRRQRPAAGRPWQATLIVAIFFVAVAGAAVAGWWYARESPPHQGPIVLISIDGLRHDRLAAYGATSSTVPAIDALAADAVVFEHAYTHSPLLLPAHASMLAGQLPFEHGVRDEAGFILKDEARPLAELLRNRGFETGAAVSSFLLRRETGVAQGFQFFDADLPEAPPDQPPTVERNGELTTEAAERWLRTQDGQRFFLFVQVDDAAADAAVTRIVQQLKDRGLYDEATIVLTADRGETRAGVTLDEAALRVPLLVKQPESDGAGRRVVLPVGHVDLLPTVLDLVRAPIPSGLSGRSLRPVLDDADGQITNQAIYAESLAARYRLGDHPAYALTLNVLRLVRDAGDIVLELDPQPEDPPPAAGERDALRARLDRVLDGREIGMPAAIAAADEDRYAALGLLPGGLVAGAIADADLQAEPTAILEDIVESQREAARLTARKQYGAAIDRLRAIVKAHPELTVVQYQIGLLLTRSGRADEAAAALRLAARQQPDNPYIAVALARVLARRQPAEAMKQATLAIALAERHDAAARAIAHEAAARIALQLADADAATAHAAAAAAADPALPLPQFVHGALLARDGQFDQALATWREAETVLRDNGRVLEDLQLSMGDALAQLERYPEAETHYREELAAFPRSVRGYTSLATLYRALNREPDVEAVVRELIAAVPTPEGTAAAAAFSAPRERDGRRQSSARPRPTPGS